jgi:hypothetical protein
MCTDLMRALYPLCRKGNRYKYKTTLIYAFLFTHFKMFPLFNWELYPVNNFRALPLSTSTLCRVCSEYIRYIARILAQRRRKLTESFRGFTAWHSWQMQNYSRRSVTYSFVVTHKMWLLNNETVFKSTFLLKLLHIFNWKLYSVNNTRALPLNRFTLYRVYPEYMRYIPRILAQYQRKLTKSFRGFTAWHSWQVQNYFRWRVTYSFVVTIHLITAPHTQDMAIK